MGKTPAAVMERAMENIALAENLETRQPELLDVEEGLKVRLSIAARAERLPGTRMLNRLFTRLYVTKIDVYKRNTRLSPQASNTKRIFHQN